MKIVVHIDFSLIMSDYLLYGMDTSKSMWELIHSYFNEIALICVGLSTVRTTLPDNGTEVVRCCAEGEERSINGESITKPSLAIFQYCSNRNHQKLLSDINKKQHLAKRNHDPTSETTPDIYVVQQHETLEIKQRRLKSNDAVWS